MIFVPYKIGNRPCNFENRHIRYYMAANFENRPIFEVSCARSPKKESPDKSPQWFAKAKIAFTTCTPPSLP